MGPTRFTDEQVTTALRQAEAGTMVAELPAARAHHAQQ
jgi:hypothetical protein